MEHHAEAPCAPWLALPHTFHALLFLQREKRSVTHFPWLHCICSNESSFFYSSRQHSSFLWPVWPLGPILQLFLFLNHLLPLFIVNFPSSLGSLSSALRKVQVLPISKQLLLNLTTNSSSCQCLSSPSQPRSPSCLYSCCVLPSLSFLTPLKSWLRTTSPQKPFLLVHQWLTLCPNWLIPFSFHPMQTLSSSF